MLGCVPYFYNHNHLHNEHGHGANSFEHMAEDRLDITRVTEDEFLDWCYLVYNPDDPKTHVELLRLSKGRRGDVGIQTAR